MHPLSTMLFSSQFRRMFSSVSKSAFIHRSSVMIGDVTVGADTSVWPLTVIRAGSYREGVGQCMRSFVYIKLCSRVVTFNRMHADVNPIRIGSRTNIQDGTVIHCTGQYEGTPDGKGYSTTIGDDTTIGGWARGASDVQLVNCYFSFIY